MAVGRCCIRIWENDNFRWSWCVDGNGHENCISDNHPDRENARRAAQTLVKGIVREVTSAKVKFKLTPEMPGKYTLTWTAAW